MGLQIEPLLPPYNYRVDDTGDLDRFANEVLQPALDIACGEADRWVRIQDVDQTDEQTANAMLYDLGNPFPTALDQPLNRKRLLIRTLVEVYRRKGTEPSLVDVLFALAGITVVQVISPADIGGTWELGIDSLADQPGDPYPPPVNDVAILGETSEYLAYSFQVEVDAVLTDEQREVGTAIVKTLKPAHTHFLGFIEPGAAPGAIDHWELGLSYLTDTGEPVLGDEIDLHE